MIWLRVLAVAVSGAAFVAAFPPYDLGDLAWVALVPLFLAVGRRPPREAFWLGYAWGIVGLGGVLWWFTAFGVVVWMLGAIFLGVFPALALGAAAWIGGGREGRFDPVRLAVLWTAVEYLRSLGPLGFPWALLGESQHRALAVSQIASVAGVYGVSFLVALVNASLACLIMRRQVLRSAVAAAVAASASVVWGTAALRAPVIPPDGSTFVAAIVQPDYATRTRWDPERAARDLDVLGRLTHEGAHAPGTSQTGAQDPVLVVWPETASPTDVPGDPAMLATLRAWVRRDHVSLIASSLEGGLTNSAFSVAPDGVLMGRYDKAHLVPFAEFGEQAGRGPGLLPTPVGNLGVAICYESTFPEFARRSVVAGADLLTILTNDAWFDGTLAPMQHAAIAPFRAIEEGRYLLRAANSGPSMIIDPHGRVIAALPLGVRGVLTARVAVRHGLTPYAHYGFLFGWAIVLASVLLLLPRTLALSAGQPGSVLARLLAVSILPLAALGAAARVSAPAAGTVVPVPVLAVLATTAVLSLGRSPRDLGLRAAGFVPALLAGLGVVAGLTVVAVRAVSAHGAAPQLSPPPGGWIVGGAAQVLVVGMTFEWWLRGLVFTDAAAWRGWTVAVLWSALLGMAAAIPRGAEAMVWGLFSGLAFGLFRARWPQVPALAVAHGAGNIALGFLLSPW